MRGRDAGSAFTDIVTRVADSESLGGGHATKRLASLRVAEDDDWHGISGRSWQ
jgi:hypothetical protein